MVGSEVNRDYNSQETLCPLPLRTLDLKGSLRHGAREGVAWARAASRGRGYRRGHGGGGAAGAARNTLVERKMAAAAVAAAGTPVGLRRRSRRL